MSAAEQGLSLGQLIAEVERAARGNLTLGTQLARLTEQIRRDDQFPQDVRSLASVLRRILAGDRNPDISALPEPFSTIIVNMLRDLLADERTRTPEEGIPGDEDEGLTLEELLRLVETAVKGDQNLGRQLFSLMQQMAGDESLDQNVHALAQTLLLILAGDRSPDLSRLPVELAAPVKQLLHNIQ